MLWGRRRHRTTVPSAPRSILHAAALATGLFCAAAMGSGTAVAEDVELLSSQFGRATEAASLRGDILSGHADTVLFRPMSSFTFLEESLRNREAAGSVVVGARHGELLSLFEAGLLNGDLRKEPWFADNPFSLASAELSNVAEDSSGYVPWVFATYLMVAHRSALAHLPPGASLESLTYEQFASWAARLHDAFGSPKVGLPLGETGLAHRFVQGYLLPSFTGALLRRFRSDDAIGMWRYVQDLWPDIHPQSLTFDDMSTPLELGEVLVAWDHTARLVPLFADQTSDFVAFSAPVGPAGRGHILVPIGLAPGAGSGPLDAARRLIQYLTRPDVQFTTMTRTGFIPVQEGGLTELAPAPTLSLLAASDRQASEPGVRSLLPTGLGPDEPLFNALFVATFADIVLTRRDIQETLDRNAALLNGIIERNQTACWAPDPPAGGPCLIN